MCAQTTTDRDLDIAEEYLQQGRMAQAQAIYLRILEDDPTHPDALYPLGIIAYQEGDLDAACDYLKQVLLEVPDDDEALHLLGIVTYLKEDYMAAVDYLRQAAALQPEFAEVHYNLANALMLSGSLEESGASYATAIALQPDHAEAYNNFAKLKQILGQLDEAIQLYQHALTLRPDYTEAQENLENALAQLGEPVQMPAEAPALRGAIETAALPDDHAVDPAALTQIAQHFEEQRYALVRGFLPPDLCAVAESYTLMKRDLESNFETELHPVPNTHAIYGDHLMESLMVFALPWVEKITGLTLLPTYSYYRVYKAGDQLRKHTDRPACEISVSLCLGSHYIDEPEDFGWGIWTLARSGAPHEHKMKRGDALIYRGSEILHWREPFQAKEGSYLAQVFLHYVDANGPHAEWHLDKRPRLGTPLSQRRQ